MLAPGVERSVLIYRSSVSTSPGSDGATTLSGSTIVPPMEIVDHPEVHSALPGSSRENAQAESSLLPSAEYACRMPISVSLADNSATHVTGRYTCDTMPMPPQREESQQAGPTDRT